MGTEPRPVIITVKPSGSISIEGEVVIQDRDGNPIPRPVEKRPGIVKLCGCGHSRSHPFCDGTHNECTEKPPYPVDPPPSSHGGEGDRG